jgi:hypothetical protein
MADEVEIVEKSEEAKNEDGKEEEDNVDIPVRADGVISWMAKKLGGAFTGGFLKKPIRHQIVSLLISFFFRTRGSPK